MFEIIPFGRRNSVSSYDPFHDFDEMERNFFRGGLGEFRTDVSDDGKSFTVEAELPGFKKEDIHLDLLGGNGRRGAGRHGTDHNCLRNCGVQTE